MSTVTAILIEDEKVVKQYKMRMKSAVNLIKRGEGMWRDAKKNVVILYTRDENGEYQKKKKEINRDASPRAPKILRWVDQCIAEQELFFLSGKEIPGIYGISVPKFVRQKERATLLKKYHCVELITNLL